MSDKDELGTELCRFCIATDYGFKDVNTNEFNLCEGAWCDNAYEYYLEQEDMIKK